MKTSQAAQSQPGDAGSEPILPPPLTATLIVATQSEPGDARSDPERDIHLKEWETARGVLAFFDEKLHDLRKYGFGFVTVLLTAEGMLVLSTDSGKSVSAEVKFAVFGVTLLLVLALQLIDKNYTEFQKAAAARALVLERKLNIELSEIIAVRYRAEHMNDRVRFIYILLWGSVVALGTVSIAMEPEKPWVAVLFFVASVAIGVGWTVVSEIETPHFEYGLTEDWMLSPLVCSQHGTVRITLTNFTEEFEDAQYKDRTCVERALLRWLKSIEQFIRELFQDKPPVRLPDPIVFKAGKLVWEVFDDESGVSVHSEVADRDLKVYDCKTWTLKLDKFPLGVYQLQPRGWLQPLRRKITIVEDKPPEVKVEVPIKVPFPKTTSKKGEDSVD